MSDTPEDDAGLTSRRGALQCMLWGGTGIVWTIAGGVPGSTSLAEAAGLDTPKGLSFLQLGDSHVGSKPLDTSDRFDFTFNKPGAYGSFCSLHPHMTGKVIVRAP